MMIRLWGVMGMALLCIQQLCAIDRQAFYSALSGNAPDKINNGISILDKESATPMRNAYLGALYMKKAGFPANVSEKLELFKKGHSLLENEIEKDPGNTEFRFLRLIIQENAPAILSYNDEIDQDKKYIVENFKKQPEDLQSQIRNYAEVSKYFTEADRELLNKN